MDQDINCRTVGHCNAVLSVKGLKELGLNHIDSDYVREMDSAKHIS